jgi:hypothetical protein
MARVTCLYSSGLAARLRRRADITHELAAMAFQRGDRDRGVELLRQFVREDEEAKSVRDHLLRVEDEHRTTAAALTALLDRIAEQQAREGGAA